MAQVTKAHRTACRDAKTRLKSHPNVVSIGIGFKYRGGVRTDEICIVVGVRKKLPKAQVPEGELIAPEIGGVETDVIEYGDIRARTDVIDVGAQSLTQKRRPCPPGYSVGHAQVTAGTLGAWVHRGPGDERYLLSNNHVIANSNDAVLGDFIRQPGRADGGSDEDRFARLTDYVRIKFDGDNGNGNGGKKSSAALGWKLWKWPANAVASLLGCPYRLVVARPSVVEQPEPNLVDAAVARVLLEDWVDLEIPSIGEIQGFRDLELGDRVTKTGRTTETTTGIVDTIGAVSQVDYGAGKGIATFDDQFVIRADAGDFSRGGDSGSAIVDEDGFVGALLFAGGDGITLANRISHVVSLLGIRL
jgi:hypothetical protein